MDLDEYQNLAARTAAMDVSRSIRQATFALGLVCEATEVMGVMQGHNIDPDVFAKELGDVLWYSAGLCTLYDLSFADAVGELPQISNATADDLVIKAGKVSDYMKKVLGHGHDLDRERLTNGVRDVVHAIHALCHAYNHDIGDVAAKNIAKLKTRYPEGFSSEASRNRKNDFDIPAC